MSPVHTPNPCKSHKGTNKRIWCCQVSIRILSAAIYKSYSTLCKGSHTGAPPFLTESVSQFIKCIQPTSRHRINDASHCSDKSNLSNEEFVWTHSLWVQSTSGGEECQSAVHPANVARKHNQLPPVYVVQGPNPQNRAILMSPESTCCK